EAALTAAQVGRSESAGPRWPEAGRGHTEREGACAALAHRRVAIRSDHGTAATVRPSLSQIRQAASRFLTAFAISSPAVLRAIRRSYSDWRLSHVSGVVPK